MNWLLIIVLVVVVLVILKFKEIRHKAGFLILIAILLFFFFTGYNVYKTNKLDLSSYGGVVTAGKVYFVWMSTAFGNVKGISGYAIKQDWTVNKKVVNNSSIIK